MNWIDIACIVFVCVTANHLGLIGTIEGEMGFRIPILNCPKCSSCWLTAVWCMGKMGFSAIPQIPMILAVSFLASYLAIWLELFEGYIDTLYDRFYEKIYPDDEADTTASDSDNGYSDGSVSEL